MVRMLKNKADLFLSIHADSALNRRAKGLSVYTLSETASDKEAEALAEARMKGKPIHTALDELYKPKKRGRKPKNTIPDETKNKILRKELFAKKLYSAITKKYQN